MNKKSALLLFLLLRWRMCHRFIFYKNTVFFTIYKFGKSVRFISTAGCKNIMRKLCNTTYGKKYVTLTSMSPPKFRQLRVHPGPGLQDATSYVVYIVYSAIASSRQCTHMFEIFIFILSSLEKNLVKNYNDYYEIKRDHHTFIQFRSSSVEKLIR